jgi:hypothetical protein
MWVCSSSTMHLAWAIWSFRSLVTFKSLGFTLRLIFYWRPTNLFIFFNLSFLMLINKLSCHSWYIGSYYSTIFKLRLIRILCSTIWLRCNRHSCIWSRHCIFRIPSITNNAWWTLCLAYTIISLSLCCMLLMQSSLEITCQVFSTLINLWVHDSLLILMLFSIFIHVCWTLLSLFKFIQAFIQLNISELLFNSLMSILA